MSSKRRLARATDGGPNALQDWVLRHHKQIQSAYREHVRTGGACDDVMWVMPATESVNDPPVAVAPYTRSEARRELARALPSQRALQDDLRGAPSPGRFYVVASRSAGRFKGTFLGMLKIPDQAETLPEATAVGLTDPELN